MLPCGSGSCSERKAGAGPVRRPYGARSRRRCGLGIDHPVVSILRMRTRKSASSASQRERVGSRFHAVSSCKTERARLPAQGGRDVGAATSIVKHETLDAGGV